MQQHGLPRRALQALRHVNAGAQHAKCERRGNRGAGVAAIRRFAGKGHHAAQAAIASRRTHQQNHNPGGPDCCQQYPNVKGAAGQGSTACCARQSLRREFRGHGERLNHGASLLNGGRAARLPDGYRDAARQQKPQPDRQPKQAQQFAGCPQPAQQRAQR